jgi:hypothetical protein
MELTDEQKSELIRTGVTKLPGIVPREQAEGALRAINMSLGEQGIEPSELPIFRAQSYCPELVHTPVITDLYNSTGLKDVAETAIAADRVQPITGGQIALRFPASRQPEQLNPHIDGMYSPNNGVPEGTIASFTALVGVFLSDIPHENMGNFTTWPGSHVRLQEYFREHGPQSLLNGFPTVEIGEPRQVTARAGDAVLCHYQLAHGIAGNASPLIRYGIFFRLSHVDHEALKWECMTDIWREWSGIQPALETARAQA